MPCLPSVCLFTNLSSQGRTSSAPHACTLLQEGPEGIQMHSPGRIWVATVRVPSSQQPDSLPCFLNQIPASAPGIVRMGGCPRLGSPSPLHLTQTFIVHTGLQMSSQTDVALPVAAPEAVCLVSTMGAICSSLKLLNGNDPLSPAQGGAGQEQHHRPARPRYWLLQ